MSMAPTLPAPTPALVRAALRLKKLDERMHRAEQLLVARSTGAAQARKNAIDNARATAADAATASANREQLLRDFHKERLVREEFHKARAEQIARELRVQQASKRAAAEEERKRVRLDDERRRQLFEEKLAEQAEQAAGRQHASKRQRAPFAAQQQRRMPAEAAHDARDARRFRKFAQQAAARKQASLPPLGHNGPFPFAAHGRQVHGPHEVVLLNEQMDALPTEALIQRTLRHDGCPHRCLGVAPNADAATVRKRYLSLARRLHPDKTEHTSAAEAFAAIEAAFHCMQ